MGFDLEAQRSGTITGFGMIEGGYFDFSSGSNTADVATRMTKAVMGFGLAVPATQQYQGLGAMTDGDVTSGNITFTRLGDPNIEKDMRVHYILLGY